ncbi:hypothetical protein BABINDRAFT_159401 [Babjeviella inositovora NRRL Y-12698]|uniref:Uncharacterized protein n=1 Tax=Babjeviella inositovora NRRL Y-12698 TaxID=984486 RepID=A0A1E3QZ17_9ASCO|nr:uncharacterized protein BABINDRAFT_159401 [Babjeviella inositovora NRRL Y-12698]ODQ82913.1 hypothetical protein BABINDRAFT_159401 [Babjeviella inositovora NRRL Y-12698]
MPFTKRQKNEIIRRYKRSARARLQKLRDQFELEGNILEMKVATRLVKTVPRPLWDVKMKDVIELERDQRLSLKSLLSDIQQLRQIPSDTSNSVSNKSLGLKDISRLPEEPNESIERMKLQLRNRIKNRQSMGSTSTEMR